MSTGRHPIGLTICAKSPVFPQCAAFQSLNGELTSISIGCQVAPELLKRGCVIALTHHRRRRQWFPTLALPSAWPLPCP
jgi:hypothetical protein